MRSAFKMFLATLMLVGATASAQVVTLTPGQSVGFQLSCVQPTPAPSPTPTPTPKPSPSPTPSPTPQAVAYAGYNKPAPGFVPPLSNSASLKMWKGETRGMVLKIASCSSITAPAGITVKLFAMQKIVTTSSSMKGLVAGEYRDGLVESPCVADWMWADVAVDSATAAGVYTVKIGDLPITVTVTSNALGKPTVPLYVGMGSWSLVLGHKLPNTTGVAVQGPLTQAYNNMFRAHRIEPFGQYCAVPPVKSDGTIDLDQWGGVCSFRSMVVNGAIAPPMILGGPFVSQTWNPPFSAWEKTLAIEPGLTGAWIYETDEPNADYSGANNYDPNLTGTAARIAASEAGCPTCRSMVTHYPDSRLVGLDIAVPSFEQIASTPPRANDWVYGACNSHGSCANGSAGTGSGAPDLMLDQPSYHALMYPVVGAALGGKSVLYYSAVQAYGRLDVWTNQYDYGGNGDGTLVLPCGPTVGHGCSTDQPIATIRMKLLRDGQVLTEKLKAAGKLSTVVRSATDWEKNYDTLNSLY